MGVQEERGRVQWCVGLCAALGEVGAMLSNVGKSHRVSGSGGASDGGRRGSGLLEGASLRVGLPGGGGESAGRWGGGEGRWEG